MPIFIDLNACHSWPQNRLRADGLGEECSNPHAKRLNALHIHVRRLQLVSRPHAGADCRSSLQPKHSLDSRKQSDRRHRYGVMRQNSSVIITSERLPETRRSVARPSHADAMEGVSAKQQVSASRVEPAAVQASRERLECPKKRPSKPMAPRAGAHSAALFCAV